MRYLSVCSGIESATVAWHPLGWEPVAFGEIDKFPSRVLAHHYPHVPNLGDFTAIDVSRLGSIDLLVGGTPCQAFSIAGRRGSLSDARGNLSLAYTVLAHELARSNGLRWAVWENVPGVLSTDDNAFGCFLGGLVGADDPLHLPRGIERWPDAGMVAGPRARAAWRIFDAQYFGLAQRRRRVFVVAGFGEGADPAQVLFERKSLHRHSPPSRETREGVAGSIKASSGRRGGVPEADDAASLIAGTVSSKWSKGTGGPSSDECQNLVTHSLRGESFDASEDGTGRGTSIVPICFSAKDSGADAQVVQAVAFQPRFARNGRGAPDEIASALTGESGRSGKGDSAQCVITQEVCDPISASEQRTCTHEGKNNFRLRNVVQEQWAVRRLTPRECERLQGFPDDYTDIPGAADGPRYKALGNSKAVPVVRWIGRQIAAADAISFIPHLQAAE